VRALTAIENGEKIMKSGQGFFLFCLLSLLPFSAWACSCAFPETPKERYEAHGDVVIQAAVPFSGATKQRKGYLDCYGAHALAMTSLKVSALVLRSRFAW
jgi:hypothetical protein